MKQRTKFTDILGVPIHEGDTVKGTWGGLMGTDMEIIQGPVVKILEKSYDGWYVDHGNKDTNSTRLTSLDYLTNIKVIT